LSERKTSLENEIAELLDIDEDEKEVYSSNYKSINKNRPVKKMYSLSDIIKEEQSEYSSQPVDLIQDI